MEKMKIAVCFSGQVRTWKYCYQNWIDNLGPLGDVDYFCHFWDYNSVPEGSKNGYDIIPEDVLLTLDEKQAIIDTLNPKKIEFESKKIWENNEISPTSENWYSKRVANKLIPWHRNQFYSLMKSANLKRQYELENNFEYDVVIRMRPDSIFDGIPIINKVKPNTLYAIHRRFSKELDKFAIGDVYYHCDSFTFDQISWFIDALRFIDEVDLVAGSPPEYIFYYYIKSIEIDLDFADANPKVVVTAESMARKGFLQGNEILNSSI
jgi:hypothetical protein